MSERFWNKVEKGNGCWRWTGAINTHGYGWLTWKGKQTHAHRVSWFLKNGTIKLRLQVLHKCDNPACVNPEHLYLGTVSDNMRDRANRRRCKTHKLTPIMAEEIRSLHKAGEKQSILARRFNLSSGHVSEIVNGKYWRPYAQ
jgi:hypothetical protein